MCVSPETTHFPIDVAAGCTYQLAVGGREISMPLTGFEVRRHGDKLVFIDSNDEVVVKIACGDDGVWYSLGPPVKITLPTGQSILCGAQPSLQ